MSDSGIVTLIEEYKLTLIKAYINDKYLQADSERLDLNSRISVVESNFRYRAYAKFLNWFVLMRISVEICIFVLQCGFCLMLM